MKLINRVCDELMRGPATSADIAGELQISAKTASAILSELFSIGTVSRSRLKSARGPGHYVYELKGSP